MKIQPKNFGQRAKNYVNIYLNANKYKRDYSNNLKNKRNFLLLSMSTLTLMLI